MKKNYLSVNNNNRSNKGGFLPCSTLFRIAKTGLSEVPLSLHSSASLRNRRGRLLQSLPQSKISMQNARQPLCIASSHKAFSARLKSKAANLVIFSVFIILLASCKSVPQASAEQPSIEQPSLEQQTESFQPEQDIKQTTQESQTELSEAQAEPATIQEQPSEETQNSVHFTEIQEPEIFDLPAEQTEEIAIAQENDDLQNTEQSIHSEKIDPENIVIHEIPQENQAEPEQPDMLLHEAEVFHTDDSSAQLEQQEQKSADSVQEIFSEPSTEVPPDITTESSAEPENLSNQEELSDKTAEISTETAEISQPEEQESSKEQDSQAVPQPSRSIQILRNQYLDIEYPGSGWIYMGENTNEHKMVFFGRRLPSDKNPNTAFTLRSRFAGTTLLHFYKNDLLTDSYIDDYLEVTIIDKEASSKEHVKAPSYQEIVPPQPDMSLLKEKNELFPESPVKENLSERTAVSVKPEKSPAAPKTSNSTQEQTNSYISEDFSAEKSGKTNIQTTEDIEKPAELSIQKTQSDSSEKPAAQKSQVQVPAQTKISENMPPSSILEQAQKEFDSKNFEKAHLLVNEFFEKSDLDLDKALFLQGQILESNSSVRDIKSAIDAYDALIKNYRRSPLWKKASERSQYLKRFYINIR